MTVEIISWSISTKVWDRTGIELATPVRSHTFVEIDHEMISTVILPLPLIHSRRVVVSYKRKYVHELLVNRLFKPAQEKVWLGKFGPKWQFLCSKPILSAIFVTIAMVKFK